MAVKEVQKEYQEIYCGRNIPLLAYYVDDFVLLGESTQDIRKATKLLIQSAKKRGLNINVTKIKCMQVDRNRCQMPNAAGLQVTKYIFEKVNSYKYLSTNLSSINDSHDEI